MTMNYTKYEKLFHECMLYLSPSTFLRFPLMFKIAVRHRIQFQVEDKMAVITGKNGS
jgi:hypothetical protein